MRVRDLLTACLTGAVLLFLGAGSVAAQEAACETCENKKESCDQVCTGSDGEGRANGADCRFGYDADNGCQHCQWEGECGENQEDQDFASVLLSPAGTTADPGAGAVRLQGDRVVLACSGLVLTHVDYAEGSGDGGGSGPKTQELPSTIVL